MNGSVRDPGETSLEPAVVTADDRLLDALGRGGAAPADDLVAGLFAAWRTDIEADAPAPGTAADLVHVADLVRAALADGPAEIVPDRAHAAEPDVRSAARRPVPGRSAGGRSVGGRPAPGPAAPGPAAPGPAAPGPAAPGPAAPGPAAPGPAAPGPAAPGPAAPGPAAPGPAAPGPAAPGPAAPGPAAPGPAAPGPAAPGPAAPGPAAPGPAAPGPAAPGPAAPGPAAPGPAAPGPAAPGRRRTARRTRRLLLGAAAAVVTAALLGLGVNHAGPTNPLWPIVEVVYPDQAAVRAADHAIALASDAVTAGRYDDARQQLDLALVHVAQVRDQDAARRLREDIRRVRVGLPDDGPNARATPGSSAPAPGAPADRTSAPTTPAPTGTPGEPGRPAPAPAAPGGPPSSPAPGLHLPIPLLPSLLPSGLPLLPDDGCLLGCPDD